jgi:hypothetical protein
LAHIKLRKRVEVNQEVNIWRGEQRWDFGNFYI